MSQSIREKGGSLRQRLDPELRREAILEAALRVFARKGYLGATNKDIAEEAGIRSPGLIYHYFPSKEDLLQAIFRELTPLPSLMDQDKVLMAAPMEEVLPLFARLYLSFGRSEIGASLIRLAASEAARGSQFGESLARFGPSRIAAFLSDYFALQMEEGRLARMSPELAARCFMGPLIALVLPQALFGVDITPVPPGSDDEIIAQAVHVFLNGHRAPLHP